MTDEMSRFMHTCMHVCVCVCVCAYVYMCVMRRAAHMSSAATHAHTHTHIHIHTYAHELCLEDVSGKLQSPLKLRCHPPARAVNRTPQPSAIATGGPSVVRAHRHAGSSIDSIATTCRV